MSASAPPAPTDIPTTATTLIADGGGFVLAEHLPALIVLVPLFGSVITAALRRSAPSYVVTLIVAWALPVLSLLTLQRVIAEGTLSYAMGGWAPPFGIELRVDEAGAFLAVLISIMAALVVSYAPRSLAAEIHPAQRGWYYTMLLLCMGGLLGMALSGDAFNIFVFMEISSLAMYTLIAMGRDRRALVAAFQYLVLGTLGATFYVIGVGLLFTLTGTLNLADIAAEIGPVADSRAAQAALAFIGVGIGLKLALFPLHLWLPNAYAFAPTVATAFLASTATKVAIYVLVRFVYTVFGVDVVLTGDVAFTVVLGLAVIAMIVPSLVACFQANVKRMLAYSSVAQVGYMMLGVALLSETGLTGGLSHLFNHAIVKAGLFLAVGCIAFSTGIGRIQDMAGIGRTMPLTMAAFVITGLGLIGVPGTAGFVSKWFLIQGAAEAGLWWLVAAIAVASVIAVFYVGRIIEVAWFRAPSEAAAAPRVLPWEMRAMTWALALATLYFGLETSISADVPARAAALLMGVGDGG